jgi:hypothetical protein
MAQIIANSIDSNKDGGHPKRMGVSAKIFAVNVILKSIRPDSSKQDHRVALPTGYAKPVKNAVVSGNRAGCVLNPAAEIISCTPRQIVDGFNAVFAMGNEHQSGESRDLLEIIGDTKLFSPRFDFGLNLLRHEGVWIAWFGIGIEGVGQAGLLRSVRRRGPPRGLYLQNGAHAKSDPF